VLELLKEMDLLDRVELARKFSKLAQDGTEVVQYFIHPGNLYLISNQLYIGHRGLRGLIEPKESSLDQFLTQYKALNINAMVL
jgi:uncharacterized membrane protein YukC